MTRILPLLPGMAGFAFAGLFLAIGLSGCTEIVNNYYFLDSEEEVDDSDDSDGSDNPDTEVGDTAVDDTETDSGNDTNLEDSGTDDTAVEDTAAEPSCEFAVDTWDGEVVMGNTLTVSLSSASPSGAAIPGTIEVLRLNFGVNDFECQALTLTGMTIFGIWTDNAETDWAPESVFAVDLATGEDLGNAAISQPGTIIYAGFAIDDRIDAGETRSIAFYADLNGASAREDDSVRFSLYMDSIGVQDETSGRVLRHDGITGGTLVF